MNCQICNAELREEQVHSLTLYKQEYKVCGWDALRIKQFIDGNITNSIINIYWGAGHVCWSSWNSVRDIIRKYNITEVLEMGIGLSSELFVNEGLDVIGIDIWKEHVELYQKHLGLKAKAVFHWYPSSKELPDFDKLYPGRKWDFVFVDGPQERANEVRLAMKLSNRFIYLHDPNMGEQSFFPNDEWKQMGKDSKLFEKVTQPVLNMCDTAKDNVA